MAREAGAGFDRVSRRSNSYTEFLVKYASTAVGGGTSCPLVSCLLMNRGLGGLALQMLHHSDLCVFTDMLIYRSKRHNMQGEIPVMTVAALITCSEYL